MIQPSRPRWRRFSIGAQGGKLPRVRFQFDRFTLDTDERRLFEGTLEARLAPKAFDLLALLVEERPRAVSKDEILRRLWPGTFVTENNLATLISYLRTVLREQTRAPRFLRTVYGYGYAFNTDVNAASAAAAPATPCVWRLLHEDREISLREGANILGRTGDGVIVLDSPTISRHHARISISGDGATVEDLGSKNGTWIGTVAVTGPAGLSDGDELRLGSVVLTVRFRRPVSSTETMTRSGS